MKLTNDDSSIVETDRLDDSSAAILEKAKELNDLCVSHKVPVFTVILNRIKGETRPSTFYSIHHPTDGKLKVAGSILGHTIRWWNEKLPRQELVLHVKEEMV